MNKASTREVSGTPQVFGQGTTEQVQYVFHLDKMMKELGTPTAPIDCVLYRLTDKIDVSSTNLDGTSNLSGLEFTTPIVKDLEVDVPYRLVAQVTVGPQIFTAYKDLIGEL